MGSDDAKPASQRKAPQGLYMFGGVGVGKTMLMDLLVTAAPPESKVPQCPLSGVPLLAAGPCATIMSLHLADGSSALSKSII
jgi:AFG1-like ATPase